MPLSQHQIIGLLQLRGYGVKTVFTLTRNAAENCLTFDSARELQCFINCHAREVTLNAVEHALHNAETILDKNHTANIGITTFFDQDFPQSLRKINNPPVILYYRGNLAITRLPSVAIVGTRNPTPEGIKTGFEYASKLAAHGINIISGLALGSDTSAHLGALDTNGGKTTACLAHGLDTIYPKDNSELAKTIIEYGGLILSEYPPRTRITKNQFLARNRIQAGLAQATLIIQTTPTGGTRYTAKETVKQNKPLFAIRPHSSELHPTEETKGYQALVAEDNAIPISQDPNIDHILSAIHTPSPTTSLPGSWMPDD